MHGDEENYNYPEQQPEQGYAEQPSDWISSALEKIRYGDDSEARQALIDVTRGVYQHEHNLGKIRDETERTRELVEKFKSENAHLAEDPLIESAAERYIADEQRRDLIDAGAYEPDQYRKEYGRDPTNQEISTAHVSLRASGHKSARSAQTLLDGAVETIEKRFGVRRPARDPAESVLARKNRARDLRGLPPVGSTGVPTEDSYNPALGVDSETFTKTVGFGGDDTETTSQPPDRSAAVEKMIHARRAARQQDGRMFTPERNR